MVPYLMGFQKGKAIFMDSDMIARADVHELEQITNGDHAVSVVQNIPRFEWPSLMVFNCDKCQKLTPEYIENEKSDPASFEWAESVGEIIPANWNFCVGYQEKKNEPKLIHYTAGIPFFAENRYCDYSELWWEEFDAMTHTCSWLELMGSSIHRDKVFKELEERNREDYLCWRDS